MYKIYIPLLLMFALAGCSKSSNNGNKPVDNTSNNKAPAFTLVSTDGKDISLDKYKGKVVIIDFWATWCGPCRKGIPDLIALQNEFGNDIVVIGISLDTDSKDNVVPFMQQIGINYPVAYGTLEVTQQYGGVEAIPTSFVINKNGEIVDQHVGLVPKSEYADLINKLLGKS